MCVEEFMCHNVHTMYTYTCTTAVLLDSLLTIKCVRSADVLAGCVPCFDDS